MLDLWITVERFEKRKLNYNRMRSDAECVKTFILHIDQPHKLTMIYLIVNTNAYYKHHILGIHVRIMTIIFALIYIYKEG